MIAERLEKWRGSEARRRALVPSVVDIVAEKIAIASGALRPRKATGLLSKLPPAQRAALQQWLLIENLSYERARDRLKKEFGVSTSAAALGRYFATFTSRQVHQEGALNQASEEMGPHARLSLETLTVAIMAERGRSRRPASNPPASPLQRHSKRVRRRMRLSSRPARKAL